MQKDAQLKVTSELLRFNQDKAAVYERVNRLTQFFAITPVDLDPHGIMNKLEHLLGTYEQTLKSEIRSLVPSAKEDQVQTLSNLLEVSVGLNTMFKVVRHFYLSAKNHGNMLAVMQLQMALPMILQQAEAYHAALKAFAERKPIGDGFGPLVARKLALEAADTEIAPDTVVSEMEFEGRKLLVVKARGPGGTVGKPGEAVKRLVETDQVSLIVTVDAALKLEGQRSGELAEGVGAAIGGPGVERFKIEEVATRKGVPLVAFIAKMSEKEAITALKEELRRASEEAVSRIRRNILERTKPGDHVIVAGIGNTVGIP